MRRSGNARGLGFEVAAIAITALLPRMVFAGDGARPRTPVQWPEPAACGWIIDTRRTSVVRIEYSIPIEDTNLTADEVPDGRRHQFFALCRDLRIDAVSSLPRWITWGDVDAAVTAGLIGQGTVDATAVLESAADWTGCWLRINHDDMRRPITFEAAREGVAWDLTQVPEGVYKLAGYTWDPSPSIWSKRPGFVRITSDPTDPERPPAASISTAATSTLAGVPVRVEGCVDAPPRSELTGWWTRASRDEAWQMFAEARPVTGDHFDLTFDPPPELEGDAAFLRVDVSDPRGRTWRAHLGHTLFVVEDDPEDDETMGTSDTGDASSTGPAVESSEDGVPPPSPSTSGAPASSGTEASGCGCWTSSHGPGPMGSWLVLLTLARQRRPSRPGSTTSRNSARRSSVSTSTCAGRSRLAPSCSAAPSPACPPCAAMHPFPDQATSSTIATRSCVPWARVRPERSTRSVGPATTKPSPSRS